MNKFLQQAKAVWGRLETPQRATIILIVLAFVAIAAVLGYGSTRADYAVLASDLSQAQAYQIAAELDAQGVPYRMADHETTILVPSSERYILRNDMAEKELLGDGSTGFELLDKNSFGQSTFLEHKKYDRAVAGELERSFRELPGVASARVIVVQPPPSPFLDADRQPSASIKLDMQAGRRLTDRQVAGVIRLAAGAVEGLSPDRVQVMDDQGLLSRDDEDPTAVAASNSMEAERSAEQHLTRKAQDMLDRVLGPGRSMVSVAVDLDFTKRSEAQSDPTTSVLLRQDTTTSDESTPVPAPAGVAGTASNVEGTPPAVAPPAEATKTIEDDTREYVVGKKTVTREDEVGIVRGMTVSILLDHKEETRVEQDPDTGAETETVERIEYTDTEKEQFAEMVLNAIGYHAAKGVQQERQPDIDVSQRFTYSVKSMPVYSEKEDVMQASALPSLNEYGEYLRYGFAAVVALVLLFVARGQLKRSHAAWQEEQARIKAEREQEQARQQHDPERQEQEVMEQRLALRDRIRSDVQNDPRTAAQMLKTWIHDG